MMVTMLLADPPNWADQLSAWSTFATAALALAAAVAAVGTLIVATKAYKSQNAVFKEQIKQLEEDRDRREQHDREQEENRRRAYLAQARRIAVRTGEVDPGNETITLVSLINRSQGANASSVYPAAYVRVTNESDSPIMNVDSEFGDIAARYCWIQGRERLQYEPRLDYLPRGATAYFVHPGIDEADVPHLRVVVCFKDDAGNCWQTNDAGKTKLL
ncbi:hypothetical protein [Nonomuraea guangzhouensis]|uniref:DUF4352 domain-containing protein n=1 Tax=Nonomuraea guangzhouensis TaxID=1291555 RepID=A0ABW4GXM1_9ACTN|nr:hypothetical protein [Nonomuraea guangzhouensis]